MTPHPFLALDMALRIGIDRLNRLEADGMPDEQLDLLRQWVEDVQKLLKLAQPPPQPPAPPMPGPGGPPMPPMAPPPIPQAA